MNRNKSIRKSAVAGSFYPGDPQKLQRRINNMLAQVPTTLAGNVTAERIFALIAPHAGYIYSGQIAATGYKLLEGRPIDTAVVISPSHMEYFQFASVFSGDAYETPLGSMQVDQTLAGMITSQGDAVKLSDRGHVQDHLPQKEHSLEVQLPFLQTVLGDIKIVPIVMGDQSWDVCEALGKSLAPLLKQQHVVAIASCDLSHFHTYEEAERLDRNFIDTMEAMDPAALFQSVHKKECEACGAGPVIAAMIAAKEAGANACRILQSANSGDVSGERKSVVGYTSAALIGE